MNLSRLSIRRPIFITMLMLGVCLFGLLAYKDIGVDLYPKVEFPVITVRTTLPGADPHTVETTVTKPIEDVISTMSSIKHLFSTSADSLSQVVVEFDLEKDLDTAYEEVVSKMGTIRSSLPDDVKEPIIQKLDIDAAPILALLVSGPLPIQELSKVADKTIKDRLQQINGVGQVTLVGKRDRTIWILIDPLKLEGFHLSIQDVSKAIQAHHIERPGGRVETGPLELMVKTKAEFEEADQLNQLLLAYHHTSPVVLSQVAHVVDGLEEERSSARLNGQSAIALLIQRQSGMNTVDVVQRVKQELFKLKEELKAKDISVEIAQDHSLYIEKSIREMKTHLFLGGFLAVLIVFLFLRNSRITLISALAIPLSVLATFFVMYRLDFTMNTMTMLALSLAIGLLIDDAIVVVENIFRHFSQGKTPKQAAEDGTSEIGLAALAITLSIVAVFLPVAFMKGIIGRFFYQFGMTVSCAVLMSLFVAFTLVPALGARFLKEENKVSPFFAKIEALLLWLDSVYQQLLKKALSYKTSTLLLAGGLFLGTLCLFRFIPNEFVPMEDQSEFNINLKAPLGSSLQKTDALMTQARNLIEKQPWVQYTFSTIGTNSLEKVHEGTIYVKMVDKKDRSLSQNEAMRQARSLIAPLPEVKTSVIPVDKISNDEKRASAIHLQIKGDNLDTLYTLSQTIMNELTKRDGYVDIDTSYDTSKPELHVLMKRDRLADLGVSPQTVAETIKTLVGGQEVSTFRQDGERYDIRLRLEEPFRNTSDSLYALTVPSQNGELIALDNLVEVQLSHGPVQIDRYNRQRIISIFANLQEGKKSLGSATKEIGEIMEEMHLPSGYSFQFVGKAESMKESFQYLLFALLLAAIMVYMVLASQFESFIHPFTIMLSLPLAFVGALTALFLTGSTLNIFTWIGFIMLLGLVTKNAILLVDYTNTLRTTHGMRVDDALIEASRTRLRPILMTTSAMIFGMLPIAMGSGAGSEAHAPMAIAVIGGLISSMFLTLIVIPAVYSLFVRKKGSAPKDLSKEASASLDPT